MDISNHPLLQEMTFSEQGKRVCYLCKSSSKVRYWTFIKDEQGFTKAVPCCDRCVQRIIRMEKDDIKRKSQASKVREVLQVMQEYFGR